MFRWLNGWFARFPLHARCAALLVLLLGTALVCLLLPDSLHTYRLSDGSRFEVIRTRETDPYEVAAQCGLPVSGNDRLEVTETAGATLLEIHRSRMVTVHQGGETVITECAAATVGDVLTQLDIVLEGDDYVRPSADTPMQDGMEIHVVEVEHRELVTEEAIPRQTLSVLDLSLGVGETRVDDEGADGLSRTTTYITLENGEVVDHEQVTEVVTNPRARRVSTGITHAALEGSATLEVYQVPTVSTGSSSSSGSSGSSSGSSSSSSPSSSSSSSSGSSSSSSSSSSSGSSSGGASYTNSAPVSSATGGVLTTSTGETYTYTQVLSCSATAYTTEGYTEKRNASGNIARVGTVAVDPTVIPLGTALYIVTDDGEYIYGYCIAEDTGGAVKGNIVDLFFNTLAECYAFGRRNCTVYVLG